MAVVFTLLVLAGLMARLVDGTELPVSRRRRQQPLLRLNPDRIKP